jgi:uncharacterized membrane protein
MIRERLSETRPIAEENFRWRGGEITRLEGFSDAVFAFALTLLVVSLEVPRTFDELIRAMKAFPAFGVCFAMLAVVWHDHCRFFRRYGLQNSWMTFLNFVLLFVVLFYIYPLKFLFFTTFDGAAVPAEQGRTLLLIYGLGYAAIFLTFLLMYVHAWKRREDLAFNAIELMKTRQSIIDHLAMTSVAVLSVAMALLLPLRLVALAGWFYFVIPVYYTISGTIYGRQEERMKRETQAAGGA